MQLWFLGHPAHLLQGDLGLPVHFRRFFDLVQANTPLVRPVVTFGSWPWGAAIKANFGQDPFKFNIEEYCSRIFDVRISKFRWHARRILPDVLHYVLLSFLQGMPSICEDDSEGQLQRLRTYQAQLRRASMVSRRWCHISRPFLLRSIVISTRSHLKRLCDLLHSPGIRMHLSPPFASCVTELLMSGEASEDMALILVSSIPRKLQALKTLVWHGSQIFPAHGRRAPSRVPPTISLAASILFRNFASVELLKLRDQSFPSFRRVCQLVTSLPKLAKLELQNVSWPGMSGRVSSPPAWPTRSNSLRALRFQARHLSAMRGCSLDLVWLFLGRWRGRRECSTERHATLNMEDMAVLASLCLASLEFLDVSLETEVRIAKDGSRSCEYWSSTYHSDVPLMPQLKMQ